MAGKKRRRLQKSAARNAPLDALYAKLPRIDCQRRCVDACGPIGMSAREWIRVEELLGAPMPPFRPISRLACPLLDGNRCTIYPVRPAICRLYGLVEALRCPYGCRPERWLTDLEASQFLERVQRVSGDQALCYLVPQEWGMMIFEAAERPLCEQKRCI